MHPAPLGSSALAVALALVCSSAEPAAQNSVLWGQSGEAWDPRGRLPDFSYAGYHGGDRPIPNVSVVADVRAFGAVGNGIADDTQAFKSAIAATSNGALLIPRGRYLITDILYIRKSNLVLRGEGRGQQDTVLYFPVSLTDVYGQKRPQFSWNYGLIHIAPPSRGRAVANVVEPAIRGDTTLTLDSAAGITPGSFVTLAMTDDSSRSLGSHLHNGQASPGTCSYQMPLTLDIPFLAQAVRGNRLELNQPLRTDVRLGWSPVIEGAPFLTEVGIENLRIEFITSTYAGHNNEDGYNGIYFENGVANSWVHQVTIDESDNAVILGRLSKWIEVRDVQLEGRTGHHGFRCEHTADCLVTDFNQDCDRRHAMSLDHRTNGCVLSDGGGRFTLEMDNHRDSPFENLFTNFRSDVSFTSSGSLCAGPQVGARTTFWNLPNSLFPPTVWGPIQTNIVGRLLGWSSMTANREWYEIINGLQPPDLHQAQLAFRQQPKNTVFSAEPGFGDRANYQERDRARWRVALDGGDDRYELFVTGYPSLAGGRLGEHATFGSKSYDDVSLTTLARTGSNPATNPNADLALVLGYQDDENYYVALFSANAQDAGIHLVSGGVRSPIGAAGVATLVDQAYHNFEFRRSGAVLTMVVDGAVVATATDATLGAGRVGVGSLDDPVWFDDIAARASFCAEPPGLSIATGGVQTMTLDAGVAHAGKLYVITGSLSGSVPGSPFFGVTVPLNIDAYFWFLIANPNTLIAPSWGQLDASGQAASALTLPTGISPVHAGVLFHHAFVVFGATGADFASNPITLTLLP